MIDYALLALILAIVSLTILLGVVLFLIYQDYVSFVKKAKTFGGQELYDRQQAIIKKNNKSKASKVANIVVDVIVGIIALELVVFSIGMKVSHNIVNIPGTESTYVVVETGSMSLVNEKNTYIKENKLVNQIPTHSLIRLDKVKSKEDLHIYDIASYFNKSGDLVIHRIVKSYEVDGYTYYAFRGDANPSNDPYLLREDEVAYKYNNEHHDGLGNFISYLKSPIGITAVTYALIILFAIDHNGKAKDKHILSYKVLKAVKPKIE